MKPCPCGSGRTLEECCGPILDGSREAATAEALMRARYSAFPEKRIPFLGHTLHPGHRDDYDEEATRRWADQASWLGLEILAVEQGGEDDERGSVEFVARYRERGVLRNYHERSEFSRYKGRWCFVSGEMVKPETRVRSDAKVGRNDPCPCGSGKKYKKCCGS